MMLSSFPDFSLINKKIDSILIFFICFGLLCSGLEIDKVFLFGFILFSLFFKYNQIQFNFRKAIFITLVISYIFMISLFNGSFKPIVFYPFFGLIFIEAFQSNRDNLRVFRKMLFFYIVISLFFGIASYFFGGNIFVTNLAEKGLPFIKPILGLTTTVQTFGTLCVLWLIINFESGEKKFSYKFFLVTIALLMTFNRTSYILFFVVLSLYSRFFLFSLFLSFIIIYILFFELINSFIFNASTLTSRSELLQGFYISFWNDNSFLGYLFGKADNFYSQDVMRLVKWDHRADIENIYAMLLHAYGFLGLFFYLVLCLSFVLYLVVLGYLKFSLIALFYLFFTQFFTQEFVTNNFYLFIAVMLSLITYKNESSNN